MLKYTAPKNYWGTRGGSVNASQVHARDGVAPSDSRGQSSQGAAALQAAKALDPPPSTCNALFREGVLSRVKLVVSVSVVTVSYLH